MVFQGHLELGPVRRPRCEHRTPFASGVFSVIVHDGFPLGTVYCDEIDKSIASLLRPPPPATAHPPWLDPTGRMVIVPAGWCPGWIARWLRGWLVRGRCGLSGGLGDFIQARLKLVVGFVGCRAGLRTVINTAAHLALLFGFFQALMCNVATIDSSAVVLILAFFGFLAGALPRRRLDRLRYFL